MKEGANLNDPLSKLSQAIVDVKNAAADREDVVVELREASRTRLELLAAELSDVIADIPADDQQFDFAISSGLVPRLWIDSTAHVAMGRDKRSYRFVRDTRLGRVVMAESADMRPVVDKITLYVAERIVDRQRMLDGEVVLPAVVSAAVAEGEAGKLSSSQGGQTVQQHSGWASFVGGLTLVLAGAIAGGAGILAWLWDKFPAGMLTP
jgi:hypothetical protein